MQQQDEAEGSWKAAIRTLTRNYRHEALSICQEDSSRTGWEISQHLLDRCWGDTITKNGKASSIIYVCPGCGATLHPGFESTSLRVARFPTLKAERTRRRRNLRRQKRLRLALQKQSKPLHRSNTPNRGEETPLVERVLLRDDQDILFDRHHLTLKCRRCACRIRLKGLKREAAPTKQDIQRKQVSTSVSFKTSKKTTLKEESSSCNAVDFLMLPPVASKAATTPAPMSVPRQFVQNTKKDKKKNRGPPEKKSKLMSFLSSLND